MNKFSTNQIKINLANKKLLIFDYDGTIADTNLIHKEAFLKALDPYKLKINYNSIAGLKTYEAIKYCLDINNIKLSEEDIINLTKEKQKLFKKLAYNVKPIKNVQEFILWASSRFKLSIASSGSKENVFFGLKKIGLKQYFEYILCSEDIEKTKPNPMIFEKILTITKFNIDQAIIFEDSENGIIAAKDSHIDFFDINKTPFKKVLKIFKDENLVQKNIKHYD